jgi:hypothetical protein
MARLSRVARLLVLSISTKQLARFNHVWHRITNGTASAGGVGLRDSHPNLSGLRSCWHEQPRGKEHLIERIDAMATTAIDTREPPASALGWRPRISSHSGPSHSVPT